ncbi:alcohol dehydrogenase catalytic domain-containing protein [Amnibacterium sp. CER49]|uniref:alcohol dehydrogenase catalytic domain-containing protein n=1 Tax=Amnibacterium sp. CER49 TaxID=3039161 RepID=UPI002448EF7E|nr:alcohol dehydrogenase catalytic domain-containing protein [Amnibacterium sp. CER49]MDH2445494.1 alcohol dehydrogenase catalytic domain-containing protein [Amnibacterium sp. CER49]
MRAAVLREVGAPLTVEDLELAPPGPGEVLVRIEAAGVCHSDLHYMTGDLPARLPIVVGHEGAGVVEALGPGTSGRIGVGDRVALLWRPRCGECDACVAGDPALCRFGRVLADTNGLMDGTTRLRAGDEAVHHLMGVSCFAERVVVSESSTVAVPEGVPPEIAAISACAVITGVGAALGVVEHAAGRPLLVLGAGGVGLAAVLGATLVGATPVLAVDLDPARLELAARFGATPMPAGDDLAERVLEATSGGVLWAIDAVGGAGTLRQALACLAPGGTLVAVGLNRAGATVDLPINDLVQRRKRIVGALYGGANPRLDLPRIFALYLAGRLPLDALVGARRPLDEVNEAYAELRSGALGRTVLLP